MSEHGAPVGPSTPRWTHIALRVADIEATIAFYTDYTPLEVLDRRDDPEGYAAWLGHPEPCEHPFILVVVQFYDGQDPWAEAPTTSLAPFNHFGIEVPSQVEVDAIAERARAAGILQQEPIWIPDPVGYVCMIADPDGNLIEYSYGQKVYETVRATWGAA